MGDLKKRVLAGLFLGPFVVVLFYVLPLKIFYVFLAIVSFLGTFEAVAIAAVKERALIGVFTVLSSIPLYLGHYGIYIIWVMGSVFIYFTLKSFILKKYESGVYTDIARGMISLIFSEVFIIIPLIYFCFLRKLNVYLPLILLFSIWSSDIAAYFLGKGFGKRPLIPHISPKKTVEGLLGAMLGSTIVILSAMKVTGLGFLESICIGIVMGILGQIGDIFESTWKRICQVKDSSGLIPGHGGILDRIDSFIFTTPFFYHYLAGFNI